MRSSTPTNPFRPNSQPLALEPRILFDGAAAVAVDHQQNHDSDSQAASTDHPATSEPAGAPSRETSPSKHLLVLDSRIENREQLLAGLPANVTALVINTQEDGLAAISAALSQMGQVDSVQILSHGSSGQFTLGNQTISASNMDPFSQTLQGWKDHLSAGADIQLYGCNVGAGSAGQTLVNELAQLTGADVAASSNDTGASSKGGDWNLEVRNGDIDQYLALGAVALSGFDGLLANAAPTVTLDSNGRDVLLGDQFTFTLNFDNTSSQIGYAPFITLFMPATGKDGDDGASFVSATYLGATLATQVITFDNAGNATHPVARGSDGQPLVINASAYGMQAGDQMVVIRVPFASVAQAQPLLPVVITANLSNLADTSFSNGTPDLTIQAIGGFELGNDSANNPTADPSILQGTAVKFVVHPTVITFSENLTTPEGETATGPNYSRTFTTTVSAAPGQTLTNVLVTQPLPDNVQVTAITPAAGGTLVSLTLADGTVLTNPAAMAAAIASDTVFISNYTVAYASLTGSADTAVQFYVPLADSKGELILDPSRGDAVTITLGAPTSSGEWVPLDPRDLEAPATSIDFSGTGFTTSFQAKSLTLIKNVVLQSDIGSPGATPGDVLSYELRLAVSDYFAFGEDLFGDGQFIIGDLMGDGLLLTGTPMLTVTLDGITQTVPVVVQQITTSLGNTALQFDIAASLQNAFAQRRWINGDLAFDTVIDGAALAVITYTAQVAQSYTPPAGTPHSEINEGDELANSTAVTASVMEGRFNISGFEQTDSSSATFTVPEGQVGVTIVSVNGNAAAAFAELHPGDQVTFSISYDLVTGDYEEFKLTAYLPQPLFDVSGITWGSGDAAGQWQLGAGNTNAGGVVSVASAAGNAVVFDLGSHVSNAVTGSRVELQFTVSVGSKPFIDQRAETVLAQSSQQTTLTNLTLQSSAAVAIISVAEPVLSIAHGVVSASNGTVTGTTGSWLAPGSTSKPFTGSVTSLAAIEGTVVGADGGDVLRLATAIKNSGGGNAYDVVTSIALPTGLSFVGGNLASANLQIYRGDGALMIAGIEYTVSGNQVTFLDAGGEGSLIAGRAGTANDNSGANMVVITYDVNVADTINAGRTLQSTATLSNYASVEGGEDFAPTDLTDTADQQIAAPTVSIGYADGTLDASDSSAAHTSGADLVIGESLLYDIVVTLPEGITQNLRVDDLVPAGLRVDTTFNGGLGYQLITTQAGSGALTSDFAGNVTISGTSGSGGTVGNDGADPRYTFSASTAAADNAMDNNSFVIRLRLVASNVIANQAARVVQNSASLQYSDPDGDTPNGSVAANRSVSLTGSPASANVREPTLQISQVLTSTSDPGGYDDGDPLSFTITISNGNAGTDFDAFDISLLNNLPIALDNVVLQNVQFLGAATNNGGTDFEIVGGQLRTTSGANIDVGKGGSIVLSLTGTVNANAAAGGSFFSNGATVQWTSLDDANTGERTGADGPLQGGTLNDYRSTSTLTIPVPAQLILSRVGGLTDTAAPNPTTASTEQVAIGEIIRYRATALMPEGVNAGYVLQFTLDNGLDVLTDSIRLAFISDGGMTSSLSLITGGTLNVSGNGTSALLQPITADLTGASPTGVLDPSRVTVTTVNGQQVVTLNLGDISNLNDNDIDLEGISVDFSVRVLNQASNLDGVALGVSATGSVSGVQRTQSETLYEQVVEPNFVGVDKEVIGFDPNPAGNTGTATVQLSMTQDGSLAAYNTHLVDGFPTGSNYTLQSLTIDGASYGPGNLPPGVSVSTSGGLTVDFDKLEAGTTVKIVYQVTVPNTTAIASTDATLTWSSLPETFTSWGGSNVGSDGAADGERDGSNVGPNTYIRTEGAGLGVIAGTLWNDTASATTSTTPDGPGLAGLTVTLTWAGVDGDFSTTGDNLQFTTTTDALGKYQFAVLPSGLLRIDAPVGTVNFAEPVGPLNVRIDTDGGTLGQIQVNLGEGSTAAANAGYVEQNAAPINAVPGPQNGLEDVPLAIGGISISDIDADRDPDSSSRALTVTLSVLQGTLSLSANPQSAGVSGANSATLVLTGTQAQLNAALANLRYLGNLNYNGADTLTVLTNDRGNFGDFDGDGTPGEPVEDARTDTDTVQINLTPVNDAPVANPDTARSIEAGGEANQLPGTNPRGSVLSNDTDVDIATNQDVLRIVTAGRNGQSQQAVPVLGSVVITGLYGTLTLGANGSYEYVLDNDNPLVEALRLSSQTLSEQFSYTLSDIAGVQASSILTVTIVGTNDTPVGVNDTATATEAGGVANGTAGSNGTGNVLTNDTDVDSTANGETKRVTAVRSGIEIVQAAFTSVPGSGTQSVVGTYGTLTINAAGNYTYVIDNSNAAVQRLVPGATLTEYFSYRLTDAGNLDDIAQLAITINGAYDNPVASNDAASATAAPNDNSSPEINPSGNVILTPSRPGSVDNGIDTDVDAPDQPSSQLQVNGVINKTEASYNPATDVLTTVTGSSTVATGLYGTLTIGTDGSYSYNVDSLNASVMALTASQTLTETFTYRVVDTAGKTDTAQLVITVRGVNDAPVANNDTAIAVEAGGLNNTTAGTNPTGNVLTNDTDVDRPSGALSVVGVGHNAVNGVLGSALAGTYGRLTLNANGSYSYVVDNANAAVQALRTPLNTLSDTFSYTITDPSGATSTANLTVTIRGANDNPLAVDDTGTATEAGGTLNNLPGSAASGNVHGNDTDVDATDTKTVNGVRAGSEAAGGALTSVSGSATVTGLYGQLLINANGTYTYTINDSLAVVQALKPGETLVERFTYRSQDQAGATDLAQLTLTIQGAWDAPVAVNDLNYAVADSPLRPGSDAQGTVLRNDTDVDANDSKAVSGIRTGTEAAGGGLNAVVAGAPVVLDGLYGQLVIGADGQYAYRVDANNPVIVNLSPLSFVLEHFTYEVRDGGNLTDLGELTILVSGGDFAPVAVDDQNVAIDQRPAPHAQGNVLPNDFDIDLNPALNEELLVTGIRTGEELGTGTQGAVGVALQGRYGTLVINEDGSYTYTIDLNNRDVLAAAGMGQVLKDVFTYTVADFWNLSDQAQLTINLDIAAPFVPAADSGDKSFYPKDDGRDPDRYFPLPRIDPVVFIGPVVERESGISELATWKSDGSNIDLVKPAEIVSDTLNQTLRPLAGQFVKAAVRQSAGNSELGLAWILGRNGRISLSADGLLSDPSVFAPLPVDMLQPKAMPHYLNEHDQLQRNEPEAPQKPIAEEQTSPLPLPALPVPIAAGQSARGFSAQLQAAAHRLPPRGTAAARTN